MKNTALVLLFTFIPYTLVWPCYWDNDTMEMERQAFPNIIELITGKFLRHSPEFHYWRIKDREFKLRTYPDSLNLIDDLAVSHSKLGHEKKAIELMYRKDSLEPGLYTTYANLGTFYLHDRNLDSGILYIEKAIEVNPDAHFGREVYQLKLAKYIQSKKKNGKIPLPLDQTFLPRPEAYMFGRTTKNFFRYIFKEFEKKDDEYSSNTVPESEVVKAVTGVAGMMKFGNYDSPILLEAIGDLLAYGSQMMGAKQLSAKAYLKASYEVQNKSQKDIYIKKAANVLHFQNFEQRRFDMGDLEQMLKQEIIQADSFYQAIRSDEIKWIKSGLNPEIEFKKKYYETPVVDIETVDPRVKREKYSSYLHDRSINKNRQYLNSFRKSNKKIDSTVVNYVDSLISAKIQAQYKAQLKKDEPKDEIGKTDADTSWNWIFLVIGCTLLIGLFLFISLRRDNA